MEWFNNIESSNEQTNEVVQEQELDLWHQKILENYEYKDMFIDFVKSLNPEDKERFLNILKHIPGEKLEEYLDVNFEDDSEENWEFFFDEFTEDYYVPENSQTNETPKEVLESIPKENTKIKEIITSINIILTLNKTNFKDKIEIENQLAITESLIKQINELEWLNISNKELKLLKDNLKILNKYKDELIFAEKQKIEAEKQKIWIKIVLENKIKIKWIDINFYNSLIQAEKDFIIDKKSILTPEAQKNDFISKKIYEYLNTWNNAVEFFEKIKKSWNTELYNKMYNSLSNISPDIKNLLISKDIYPLIDEKRYIAIMPNWHQEWDKYVSWDKYIDFSETPPIWYITLENWLKLKTKITAPHTMKLRAEFAKKQKEYEKTVWKLKENIENLDSEITDLKDDITEKKSRIEQIKNSDVSPEDKQRFIESIKEIILKNQQLIETKIKLINENKSAIEMENAKFKKVKDIFEENMYELIEAARDELLEWDEKVRKSLQFLDSIGIDSALLPALEKMIKMINHNSALRNKLGFDRRIDLSKFDLWIDNWLGNNDDWENSIKTKEKFASIVNILLSGSRKRPIVTESMSTWTTFTNESWEILSKDRAMWDIKEDMWMNTYGHMMVNAMEYNGEDE